MGDAAFYKSMLSPPLAALQQSSGRGTVTSMGGVEFWDAQAEAFDDVPDHGLLVPSVRRAWGELLLPLMPSVSSRVADIGCGTGSVSLLLASAGHLVSGLDISPAMIAKARLKFAAAGFESSFSVGDAASLSWPPASFDVVMTRHVLWALSDPYAAVARWVGLLAPGGVLLLVEGLWHTGAGLSGGAVSDIVLACRIEAQVVALADPALWGGPISDERFMVVSRR